MGDVIGEEWVCCGGVLVYVGVEGVVGEMCEGFDVV